MSARTLAVAFVLTACGAAPPAMTEPARADDPLEVLFALAPEGSTVCVAVRSARIVDRRRPLAATLSVAGSLAWARTPHVRSYLRCDAGTNHARIEIMSVDALDTSDRAAVEGALGIHVRWAGEPCAHDECDWPVVRAETGILVLSRREPIGVTGPGVEVRVAAAARARPDFIELRIDQTGRRFVLPDDGGLAVVDGDAEPTRSSWEELELAVEDERIAEDAVDAHAALRALRDVADASAWSADLLETQLGLRFARARRRARTIPDADREAIETLARLAIERWPDDLVLVTDAARALSLVSDAAEALVSIDALARVSHDDDARRESLETLARELALDARDPSLGERLVAAGLAAPESVVRIAETLAVLRETHGAPYPDAESLVRAAALAPTAPRAASHDLRTAARAVPALLWMVASRASATAEVELWARGPTLTPAAAISSPGLAALGTADGIYVEASGRMSERLLSIGEILERALEGCAAGTSVDLTFRVTEGDTTATAYVHGTTLGTDLVVDQASELLAALDAPRVARLVAAPLSDLVSRRFPAPVLRFEIEAAHGDVERALRLRDVRGCEVEALTLTCEPGAAGASEGLEMIRAVAEILGVIPE